MTVLNLTQRIFVVIVWGAIVSFLGAWVTSAYSAIGWVAYAPLGASAAPGSLASWARLLTTLGLIAIWTLVSMRVLDANVRDPGVLQRIVLLIGLGVALFSFGEWVETVGYPGLPVRVARFHSIYLAAAGTLPPWVLTLVWIGLALLWGAAALWLFRDRSRRDPRPTDWLG